MWIKRVPESGGILRMKEIERSERIHDALDFLDDDMIEEVDRKRCNIYADEQSSECKNSNSIAYKRWKKWAALAASIAIIVIISGAWNSISQEDKLHNNMESIESDSGHADEQNNTPNLESKPGLESTSEIDGITGGNETVDEVLGEESKVEMESTEETEETEETE